jgi:hypothetical protein
MTASFRKYLKDYGNNKEHHNLRHSPDIIQVIWSRKMRCEGNVARIEEVRDYYKFKLENLKGRDPIARPSRRWYDNINMDLRERDCECVDCIHLAKIVVDAAMIP